MRTARLLIGVIGACFAALSLPATAQLALPDGPNRELVSRTCGACHDVSTVVSTGGKSREDWNYTIDDMMSYGMVGITAAERRLILEYLATYLPPR